MYEELREQANDYRADVIMLDNAARLFAGKENDRGRVTRFVVALNAIRPTAGTRLTAHPGRAVGSEFSGSSAWENAARARMFLSDREPDAKIFDRDDEGAPTSDRRYLAKRKTNSARDLRTFRCENGALVPEQAASESDVVYAMSNQRDERIVLDGFKELINGRNQQPTDGDSSPNNLPKLLLQLKLPNLKRSV